MSARCSSNFRLRSDHCFSNQLLNGMPLCSQQNEVIRKSFILGFKCYKEDEYNGVRLDGQELRLFDSPAYSCKFGPTTETNNLLAVACEDGRITIQRTFENKSSQFIIDQEAHGNAVFDISWIPQKSSFISASADCSLLSWSLENVGKLTPIQRFCGHLQSVKTVNVNSWDPNVFASGGFDGNIVVWDTRCLPSNKANLIVAHPCLKSQNSSNSHTNSSRSCTSRVQNNVASVLFSEQHLLLSAGATDGFLKIWDMRKTYCISKREPQSLHVLHYSGNSSLKGYTSLSLSPNSEKVYVSCLDGRIYAYHLTNPTPKPVAEYFGHKPKSNYSKTCLSPCGSFLLSGSGDNNAYIWSTRSAGCPIASFSGHMSEITAVAWSPKHLGMLVTCSDDFKHRIFRLKNVNPNDIEVKSHLRSFAIPYQEEKNTHTFYSKKGTSLVNSTHEEVNNYSCIPTISLNIANESSYLLDSPSRSHAHLSHSYVSDIPDNKEVDNGFPRLITDSNGNPSSIQAQVTPKHLHSRIGIQTAITPKTSERKTLLAWLSNSKTPKERTSTHTPQSSPTSKSSSRILLPIFFSSSKSNQENLQNSSSKSNQENLQNSSSKSNQENLQNEDKKLKVSPTKCILTSADNVQKTALSNCVAKMLKYDDAVSKPIEDPSTHCLEDEGSFQPLEEENTVSNGVSIFKNKSSIFLDYSLENLLDKTPVKKSNPAFHYFSPTNAVFTSPTANLPNYIIDGNSPHNRLESPIKRKCQSDWLTSLSQKKKNKFALGMEKISGAQEKSKGKVTALKKKKKVVRKKRVKTGKKVLNEEMIVKFDQKFVNEKEVEKFDKE